MVNNRIFIICYSNKCFELIHVCNVLTEEWKSMNLKLSESESIICELTTRNDEIKAKENSISVINRIFLFQIKTFFLYI